MLAALHAAVPGAVMMSGENLLNANITTPIPLNGGFDDDAHEASSASEATRASRGAVRPVGPPPIPTRAGRSLAVPAAPAVPDALPAPDLTVLAASSTPVPADPEVLTDEGSADEARVRRRPWWIALASVLLVVTSVFVATVLQLTSERSAPGRITPTDIAGPGVGQLDPMSQRSIGELDVAIAPAPEGTDPDALVDADAGARFERTALDREAPDTGPEELDERATPVAVEHRHHAVTARRAGTARPAPKKAAGKDAPTPRPQVTAAKVASTPAQPAIAPEPRRVRDYTGTGPEANAMGDNQ